MIEDSEDSRLAAEHFKAATEQYHSFYFTFGGDRLHKYVHIIATDREAARQCMFERYGKNWAFCYSEDEFNGQVATYGLQLLETIRAQEKYHA